MLLVCGGWLAGSAFQQRDPRRQGLPAGQLPVSNLCRQQPAIPHPAPSPPPARSQRPPHRASSRPRRAADHGAVRDARFAVRRVGSGRLDCSLAVVYVGALLQPAVRYEAEVGAIAPEWD